MTYLPDSQPDLPTLADDHSYLLVLVGGEWYALSGTVVREIARWRAPTAVPGVSAVLPGIISQRGLVLPIVDLRLLLDLPAAAPNRDTRLVICRHDPFDLALLVDRVADLLPLAEATLDPPPHGLPPRIARLLSAVTRYGDQPLGVIDLAALITLVQEDL